MKQKPRSQGIEVRDRWEGDPRESPGKGSWFVVVGCCFLLFVVVWCCLLLFGFMFVFVVVVVLVLVVLVIVLVVVVVLLVVLVVVVAAVAVASSVAVALAQCCCCCCLGGKHACWLLQVLLACCSLLLPAINQPPTRNQQPDIFSATHSKQQNTT